MGVPEIRLIDATTSPDGEKYLYSCLAPLAFRRYRKRAQYLEAAIRGGFRKEVLLMDGDAVGIIEYAPAPVSAYPISGPGAWAMNCIWVLRRAKGLRFGKMLVGRMIGAAKEANGFATVALEGHWSPWLRLNEMEYLGYSSIDSRLMRHRVKRPDVRFRAHLMWMPLREGAGEPTMDWERLSRGVDFCIAHPLYRAERLGQENALEIC